MYLIRDIHNIDFFNKKFSSKPLIATIGNFDGLHLGHKEIIKKMNIIYSLSHNHEWELTKYHKRNIEE